MAKKNSAASAAEQQLRAAVRKLQSQLAVAERSAARWKARAKDHRSVASGIRSELGAARKRLERAEASVTTWKNRAQAKVVPLPRLAAVASPTPDSAPAATVEPASGTSSRAAGGSARVPDAGWTVAQLRAEARARGLTGYSRKTKAELVSMLGG